MADYQGLHEFHGYHGHHHLYGHHGHHRVTKHQSLTQSLSNIISRASCDANKAKGATETSLRH